MFILRNARLIPELTEGFDDNIGDVSVDGKFIKGIYHAGTEFENCVEIDLQGKTLLPGMIDLHVHLYFSTINSAELEAKTQSKFIVDTLSYAKEFLKQGFTTVRECGSSRDSGIIARLATEKNIVEGPRVLTAGRCISPTTAGCDNNSIADTPEEILKACRYEYINGADFIKYYATNSVTSSKGVPDGLLSSRREIFALQEAVNSLGIYAAVHCHTKSGIMLCIEAGIRSIEHASDIDEECIELIHKLGNKTCIVPTLGPVGLMRDGQLDEEVSNKIKMQPVKDHKMLLASRSGVLTGWGTDVTKEYYIKYPGSEFALRKERGYSNIETLQQATINSAQIAGLDDILGTIKTGKLADFVIIDGRPDEDISAMYRLPYAVYKEGIKCQLS